ncbi:hypothetical protein FHW88_000087 [Mucilaginibacter sp. SG538B]|uniref:hypothetical protein n=1 Tax=unclassified Mucilaginibacter TaxID=2617802 RepID=UPI000B882210|nr:hypothetical protein [Mucilaginibacter sp. SG538B]NVM61811.1 hypothetical protein [Mucilaginibacter sp. SG538B]
MKKTDEYMLNRIMWKADKHEICTMLDDHTSFFNDLSEPIKLYLKSNLIAGLSGIPVLFFTKSSNQWTLLCTKQVIGCSGENIFRINFQNIAKIEAFQTNRNMK